MVRGQHGGAEADVARDPSRAEADVRERPARDDHVEAVHRRRRTIGVDGDGGVGMEAVSERRPPRDARPPRPCVHGGHDDRGAHVAQDLDHMQADREVVPRLGVAACGGGSGGVARLGRARDSVEDLAVDLARVHPVVHVVPGIDEDDLPGQRLARRRPGGGGGPLRARERHDREAGARDQDGRDGTGGGDRSAVAGHVRTLERPAAGVKGPAPEAPSRLVGSPGPIAVKDAASEELT